jgi:hypothetical protein
LNREKIEKNVGNRRRFRKNKYIMRILNYEFLLDTISKIDPVCDLAFIFLIFELLMVFHFLNIKRTKWNSNPFVLGSYSYIDVSGTASHIEILSEPICKDQVPLVLFAGEATSKHYYSTVHGAYLSGQREAKRLLDYYTSSSSR